MNKKEFLQCLKMSLKNISEKEKNEILQDYEEHFDNGKNDGKTEEEISESLGDCKKIAKMYKVNYLLYETQQTTLKEKILTTFILITSLSIFNIIIAIIPLLASVAILLTLFGTSVGTIGIGILTFLISIGHPILSNFIYLPYEIIENAGIALILSLGVISLGCLLMLGEYYLCKVFYNGFIKYLHINCKILDRRKISNEY